MKQKINPSVNSQAARVIGEIEEASKYPLTLMRLSKYEMVAKALDKPLKLFAELASIIGNKLENLEQEQADKLSILYNTLFPHGWAAHGTKQAELYAVFVPSVN